MAEEDVLSRQYQKDLQQYVNNLLPEELRDLAQENNIKIKRDAFRSTRGKTQQVNREAKEIRKDLIKKLFK